MGLLSKQFKPTACYLNSEKLSNNTLGFSVLIAAPFMCISSYLSLSLLKT